MIPSFSEFINEMAIETGINGTTFSFKHDWDKFYKNTNKTKLLKKDIGANHYKLYQIGLSFFILTDENDEYLGHVELKLKDKVGRISSSFSSLPRGFYNIIFTTLLSLSTIDEILSDTQLSTQAINSYEKLKVNGALLVQIYNEGQYIDFNRDTLKDKANYRVSVKEKFKGHLKETFDEYYSRIYTTNTPSTFKICFENYGSDLDNYLFCENFENEEED